MLSDTVVVHPGVPPIDLTRQGEAGIGAARPHHVVDGSVALTDRGSGIRLSGTYRSPTRLLTGSAQSPELLSFGRLTTFNLRAFAELGRILPQAAWAKGGKVTLIVQNLANARQRVTDSAGTTPLPYQPGYRDALGRTVLVELRKVF